MQEFSIFTLKTTALVVAWALAQIPIEHPIIAKGFDQLFSIGLLMVVLFMLYKEYKSSQNYNAVRDKKIEAMLENQMEINRNVATSIEALTNSIEKLVEENHAQKTH